MVSSSLAAASTTSPRMKPYSAPVAWYFVVLEAMLTPLGHTTAQHTRRTHQRGGGQEAELRTTPCGDLCGRGGRVALKSMAVKI